MNKGMGEARNKAAKANVPPRAVQAPSRSEDSSSSSMPPSRGANHGEGDPESARHYNEAQQQFVQSGRVQQAADAARPRDDGEAEDMQRAEQQGREHAKGEDPTVPGANATLHRPKRPS
ncbi:MAG: hypothetical protein JNL85_00680 [Rubrivivax sp.]|nr:hypothetical protein [Rubrivivax sp.]